MFKDKEAWAVKWPAQCAEELPFSFGVATQTAGSPQGSTVCGGSERHIRTNACRVLKQIKKIKKKIFMYIHVSHLI